jgi:phosphate transport system substrate-binding protein
MKISALILSAFSIFLVAPLFCGCTREAEKVIRVAGSKTMVSIIKNTSAAFVKTHNIRIEIDADESVRGFESLIGGSCDIVNSSIRIPAVQLLEAQRKTVAIKEILIAYDMIVPIVHPLNPINNLFLGQFSDIYNGLLRDWKDVGGYAGQILLVDWYDSSDTKLAMHEKFFESGNTIAGRNIQYSGNGIISYISKHKNSIGYISKIEYNKNVKPVLINGVGATPENVANGCYPLYREIYFYINEKFYKGTIKIYIDFVLSKKGQEILQNAGFIPAAFMKKITY